TAASHVEGQTTLPAVVDALLDPSADAARSVHTDREALRIASREVGVELRRLVRGDLAGMFDGPTSGAVDLDAPVVDFDLSAVYHSDALGILMVCVAAWLQRALARNDGTHRIVILDEAWALLRHREIVRFLQSSWKLARSYGVQNIAILHRLSDLAAAGGADTEEVRLAQGLLSDSETRVIYSQPPGEVEKARELLGLTDTEAELITRLPRGVALWKVGQRSFLVEHRLGAHEHALVDTDARMSARLPA
ncbi:MAG: ATP-binding protein, partial [Candidatus Dormibacteraeota bacterium]|nr:ATP-binding protein [Candidatus Dormibacteraeota bacterium]